MNPAMTDEPPRKDKFRHTRELVKLALDDGMTQEEVARLCRTQQSVVSAWKHGKSKATAAQVEPLLRRYGARMRRTTSRTYLLELARDPPQAPPRLQVVEGPVIFRHTLTRAALRPRRGEFEVTRAPFLRVIVHELPGKQFVVVLQQRRRMPPSDLQTEEELLRRSAKMYNDFGSRTAIDSAIALHHRDALVESNDDAARWETAVEPARDLDALLAWLDRTDPGLLCEHITLRFLLRKALLEHGHPVPDVARVAIAE